MRDETTLSDRARRQFEAPNPGPLFVADWERVLMIHYETDPTVLQPLVPFQLDLRDGRAYVSLVAFTQSGMRSYRGWRLFDRLVKPMATHEFLNLRTYVRVGREAGIYFLAEWLPNRLSVALGPRAYGLPYRFGHVRYDHDHPNGRLRGVVLPDKATGPFVYSAQVDPDTLFESSAAGSLTEFLMERYTAFTARGTTRRAFRVWHPTWPQAPVVASVHDDRLVADSGDWYRYAEPVGANYSPGVRNVWLGSPRRCPQRPTTGTRSRETCGARFRASRRLIKS